MPLSSVFETFDAHGLTVVILQRWSRRRPGEWIWSYVVLGGASGRLAELDDIPSCELARAGGERAARLHVQLRDGIEFIRPDVSAFVR